MITAITMPVLNFYRFHNVALARQIRREIELAPAPWRRAKDTVVRAQHSDIDQGLLASAAEMRTWFQQCLDQVVSAELAPNYGCSVTEMWMTQTRQGESMHPHSHPLSVYSGVFYLQDSEGTTDFTMTTWFHERWPQMAVPEYIAPSQRQWHSPCREGHLIIFPSHIFHRQQPLTEQHTRYTVAWNSFWQGQIGTYGSTKLWVQSHDQAPP